MGSSLSPEQRSHMLNEEAYKQQAKNDSIFEQEALKIVQIPKLLFENDQINRLKAFFNKQDDGKEGYIQMDQVRLLKEINTNPFKERIFTILEKHLKLVRLDLNTFLKFLLLFHPETKRDIKLQWLFLIYDVNQDGYVDMADLCYIFKGIFLEEFQVPPQHAQQLERRPVNEQLIQEIAKNCLRSFDLDRDSRLSFDEFVKAVGEGDLKARMDINF